MTNLDTLNVDYFVDTMDGDFDYPSDHDWVQWELINKAADDLFLEDQY